MPGAQIPSPNTRHESFIRSRVIARILLPLALLPTLVEGQAPEIRDRDSGLATGIKGLYVAPGQLVAYPAFQRIVNLGAQYSPGDFDVRHIPDVTGKYRSSQGVLFVGYGLSQSLAAGVRVGLGRARLDPSPQDRSSLPEGVRESGLADLTLELTWRFHGDDQRGTQMFLLTEFLLPHHASKSLIGTEGLTVMPAMGVARPFGLGTLAARFGMEYDAGSRTAWDFGRWNVEWLRGVSPSLRFGTGLEGQVGGSNNLDEVWVVSHAQWMAGTSFGVRLQNTVGLTTSTRGVSYELGAVLRLPD